MLKQKGFNKHDLPIFQRSISHSAPSSVTLQIFREQGTGNREQGTGRLLYVPDSVKSYIYRVQDSEKTDCDSIGCGMWVPSNSKVSNAAQGTSQMLFQEVYPALSLIQAGCINVIGILSILSGVPLSIALLLIFAQGAYLVLDVHRTKVSVEASEAQLVEMRLILKELKTFKEKYE